MTLKRRPTKTIGPLHLEDLEPHRFEDLIRQLLYDFRKWRQLEATGRSGGDEGFDARAFEATAESVAQMVIDDNEVAPEDDDPAVVVADRLWLIQCKREKVLGPAKMKKYLENLPVSSTEGTYGIVFVAACDFSVSTRDAFREKTRETGFAEAYLWGKGEIEDLLFQPKNDHLLFAYFGISLRIRQRSLKTEVRGRLAMKRKTKRLLREHQPVVIRDASDDRYPYLDADEANNRYMRGRWRVTTYLGCFHDGLRVLHRRSMAFLDLDNTHWDYAETFDHQYGASFEDPWANHDELEAHRRQVTSIWNGFAEEEKGWIEVKLTLPYERIIDIDENGDDITNMPQIYVVTHISLEDLYGDSAYVELSANTDQRDLEPIESHRVQKFPRRS